MAAKTTSLWGLEPRGFLVMMKSEVESSNFTKSQIITRMAFLWDAGRALLCDDQTSPLAHFYMNQLRGLSIEHRIELTDEVKQWMCKQCSIFLVAGKTARVRVCTRSRRSSCFRSVSCREARETEKRAAQKFISSSSSKSPKKTRDKQELPGIDMGLPSAAVKNEIIVSCLACGHINSQGGSSRRYPALRRAKGEAERVAAVRVEQQRIAAEAEKEEAARRARQHTAEVGQRRRHEELMRQRLLEKAGTTAGSKQLPSGPGDGGVESLASGVTTGGLQGTSNSGSAVTKALGGVKETKGIFGGGSGILSANSSGEKNGSGGGGAKRPFEGFLALAGKERKRKKKGPVATGGGAVPSSAAAPARPSSLQSFLTSLKK